MLLYDPTIPASLLEFGILIPLHDSRTIKTFEALKNHPRLGATIVRWHKDRIDEIIDHSDLQRVHTPAYVERLHSDRLEEIITATYELIDPHGNYYRYDPDQASRPLTALFNRIRLKAAGTVQCARMALAHGFCYYLSGGMHHAHADHGSGFCLINDIVIAARKLQAENRVGKVWIIDTDAHKGDGTAATTAGDDSIVTLSIHMAHGWPLDGPPTLPDGTPNPSFTPSDIDIPIAAGDEKNYLTKLEQGLSTLASSAPAELAIVVCGADPYEADELPSAMPLKLSLDQLMARDQMVYGFLKNQHVPAAFLMAGGYGDKVWQVFAQFATWALLDQGWGS